MQDVRVKQAEAIKVLQKAKEILEKDGWCQVVLEDKQGRHCALGAIYAAAPGTRPSTLLAGIYLNGALPQPYNNIITYNDELSRTVEEIYQLFDKAIHLTKSAMDGHYTADCDCRDCHITKQMEES